MAGQMTISLRADPAEFESGTSDASRALDRFVDAAERGGDDAAEAFEDLVRQIVLLGDKAGKSGTDIAKDLEKIGLSADDATAAVKAVADEAEQAGGSLEGAGSKADSAGEGLRSLGDVARSALGGDFAGAAESAVSALGGLAGAIGGGAIAGAIASAVGGIVGNWIDEWNRAAAETEQRVTDMADALIDANGRIDESFVMSGVKEFLSDKEKMAEVSKLVAASGVDEARVLRALNGDLADAQSVTDGLADSREHYRTLMEEYDRTLTQNSESERTAMDTLSEASEIWERQSGVVSDATSRYESFSAAQSIGISRMAETAVAAGQATKSVDVLGNTVYTLPDGKTVTIDAATGQAVGDIEAVEQIEMGTKTVTVYADVGAARGAIAGLNGMTVGINVVANGGTRRAVIE